MFDRCLYFNLNQLTRRVNKIWDNAFKELGLSPAHAYLLRLVNQQPGISQQQIAEELNLEKSTVTRFIDSLTKKSYLVRLKSGRSQLIYPSESCKLIAQELEQQGQNLYQKMQQNLGEQSLLDFVDDIKQTSQQLD